MKDELISLETAKLTKEKGFDVYTRDYYNHKGELGPISSFARSTDSRIAAPTQSLLQRWLREEHYIQVSANTKLFSFKGESKASWHYHVNAGTLAHVNKVDYGNYHVSDGKSYDTHEQALEQGLLAVLQTIKAN